MTREQKQTCALWRVVVAVAVHIVFVQAIFTRTSQRTGQQSLSWSSINQSINQRDDERRLR